jgi:hypothetical protein
MNKPGGVYLSGGANGDGPHLFPDPDGCGPPPSLSSALRALMSKRTAFMIGAGAGIAVWLSDLAHGLLAPLSTPVQWLLDAGSSDSLASLVAVPSLVVQSRPHCRGVAEVERQRRNSSHAAKDHI